MADIFNNEKRSEIMRKVKSKKNKSTELRLIDIFKQNGITGWKRNYPRNVRQGPGRSFGRLYRCPSGNRRSASSAQPALSVLQYAGSADRNPRLCRLRCFRIRIATTVQLPSRPVLHPAARLTASGFQLTGLGLACAGILFLRQEK